MAMGVNRYLAVPVSSRTGTNTIQIDSVDTNVGDGDLRGAVEYRADQRLAQSDIAMGILDFDGGVVDQDTDGEREAPEGHHVDGLAHQAS